MRPLIVPLFTFTEILRGGVKIIKNRDLSYAPKVNWLDIVKDETANITILDNGPESEWDHEASGKGPPPLTSDL